MFDDVLHAKPDVSIMDFRNEWQRYLKILLPFCKSLDVLRYTFVAILTKEQLSNMLECETEDLTLKLPTNAVIGCVRYHFPAYGYHESLKVQCCVTVIHCILNSLLPPSIH